MPVKGWSKAENNKNKRKKKEEKRACHFSQAKDQELNPPAGEDVLIRFRPSPFQNKNSKHLSHKVNDDAGHPMSV